MEASRSAISLARRASPLVSALDRMDELREESRSAEAELSTVAGRIETTSDELRSLTADRERLAALGIEREGLLVGKERLAIAAGIAVELGQHYSVKL